MRIVRAAIVGVIITLLALAGWQPAFGQVDTTPRRGFERQAPAPEKIAEKRIALVIGNKKYKHVGPLTNTINDATMVAEALQSQGFQISGGVHQDLDHVSMVHAIQEFARDLRPGTVAVIYYAGHGIQIKGENWLVPTDAYPVRPSDVETQMVKVDWLLQSLGETRSRLNLILLDACRNNPFPSATKGEAPGLASEANLPHGTFISFATQPKGVALDGPEGGHGPYARALDEFIRSPDVEFRVGLNKVGLKVEAETQSQQVPWIGASPIDGDFYFGRTFQKQHDDPSDFATNGVSVDFQQGLAVIAPGQEPALKRAVDWVNTHLAARLVLVGQVAPTEIGVNGTDDQYRATYQTRLAANRVDQVRKWLIEQKVNSARIVTEPAGQLQAAARVNITPR